MLARDHGPVATASDVFPFGWTEYYRSTMGSDLLRLLLVFERSFDPGRLVDAKIQTNEIEHDVEARGGFPEARPVNVDPGYLTQSKLVLASTKDHAHRVYLGSGVHGEVTLAFHDGAYRPHPWTYPDYRSDLYARFLMNARAALRHSLSAP